MKKIIRRTRNDNCQVNNVHPLLNRVYSHRGINSNQELERNLENLLPFAMLLNIDAAINCLVSALQKQQHIMVIGDFDADGATSTTLAVAALRIFGAAKVSYLVPNRFEFGYGLTPEIVAVAAKQHPDLIITVDNGISSIDGVNHAKELGIKVLITDHHLPANQIPDAEAIVNPNQIGDLFPSKNLAGVGVIFYVMLALRAYLRQLNWFVQQNIPEPNMAQFLDLVALGTVADVVTLDKNNRILVYQGLQRIRAGKACVGIKALLTIAGRKENSVKATELGFVVAPRLNAAGRLEDMSLGIECLLTSDPHYANEIAVRLDSLNRERQAIEEDMQQQAYQVLTSLHWTQNTPVGICLYDEKWHQGVIGILASRIKDQMHRPVIAFARFNTEELKGSARSINGIHIRDVLTDIAAQNPKLIIKFGGHAMAAGIQILEKNFSDFCQIFDQEIRRRVNVDDLQSKIYSDGELTLPDFSLNIVDVIQNAGPWGQGFPEPIFDGIFYVLKQYLVGQRHLKMVLSLESTASQLLEAIAFNVDTKVWPKQRCEKIIAAYRLDINEYRGLKNLQLIIEHLEPAC